MKQTMISTALAGAVAQGRPVVSGTKASINSKGELLIYGIIGDWWDMLDAESVVRQAEEASAGKEELIVRIHSEGGNVVAGLAIYNALKQSSKRVVAYVDGIAASMASAVVCAADVVRMPSNALMMIHKASLAAYGNADDLRDLADQLEVLEGSYLDCYAKKGNQTIEQLKALVSDGKDHWLTAQQCVDMGFCDEILAEPIKVAATYRPEDFHNPPGSLWSNLVAKPKAASVAKTTEYNAMKKFKVVGSGGAPLVAAIMTALVATYVSVDDAVAKLSPLNLQDLEKLLVGDVQASDAALTTLAAALNVQVPAVVPTAVVVDATAAADAAVARERQRSGEIHALGTKYGLTAEQVQAFVSKGVTVADARSQVLDIVAARSAANQPLPGVRVNHAVGQAIHGAMVTALLNRCNPSAHKIDDAAKPFAHLTLVEMARAHLQAFGVDTNGMAAPAIATMALQTSSDFANILADVANKSLRMGYEAAPRTFTAFARRVTAADFKPINNVIIDSGGGALAQVNESGEYHYGKLLDGKETYRLATYGEIIAITRKTLVNDDLSALSRIPQLQGAQVAETESKVVWDLILNNTVLSDGVALFHATHANLGTGVIAEAGLSAGRTAMRKQKKMDGATPMNLSPSFLVVPAALETTAQKMLATIAPDSSSSANPFAGSMQLLVEARLDAASALIWYMVADSNRIDTIEYAYLAGQEGAYMETRNGFEVDGVEMKVRLDFGAGLIDHRGFYKSTGA